MATTKLSNSKRASRVINYAEKRAVEKSGFNCDPNYAKSQFKALRELHGKNDGVQAHTIIQSFKPHETNEKEANQIGLELAEKVADGYQVSVYTHNDTEHIHNHIVINAVGLDGQKYKSNAKQRYKVKEMNDEICKAHGLSVIEKQDARTRYSQAELELDKKGKQTWKEELRESIDLSKGRNNDFESFQEDLGSLGIQTKLRGATVSYRHPDVNRWVRGKKLGADYELGGLENEFARQIERTETINNSHDWEEFGRNIVRSDKAKRLDEKENVANRGRAEQTEQRTEKIQPEHKKSRRKTRNRNNGLEL